jgi:uncharacterized protein (DUF2345 family)
MNISIYETPQLAVDAREGIAALSRQTTTFVAADLRSSTRHLTEIH